MSEPAKKVYAGWTAQDNETALGSLVHWFELGDICAFLHVTKAAAVAEEKAISAMVSTKPGSLRKAKITLTVEDA